MGSCHFNKTINVNRSFVRNTSGVYTSFGDSNATNGTRAFGINDADQVVGDYGDATGSHGFLLRSGVDFNQTDPSDYTTLDDPSATNGTFAFGINNAGQVVGDYGDATGRHAFVENGGIYTNLNDPSATGNTQAFGISNTGQIAGFYNDATGSHGFLASPVPEASATVSLGLLLALGLGGTMIAAKKKKASAAS